MTSATTHVLLVEDNPGDVDLIREALRDVPFAHFELASAERLYEALAWLSPDRLVDVVLLDLALPDSRGLGTLVALKQHSPDVPVVVMTGLDDQALALEALKRGAQDYLVKGKTDGDLVVRSILYAMERRRAESARLRLAEEQAIRMQAEDARERTAFLAKASVLLAASFDYEGTLVALAGLAVRRLSDFCAIVLNSRDQSTIESLAVAHADPSKASLVEEAWCSFGPNAPSFLADVGRTQEPLLLGEIPDSFLREAAPDPETLGRLRALAPTSAIVVPLLIRGRLLGTLSLGSSRPELRYGPHDLEMAEDLGYRIALAVDNARLYHDAQEATQAAREALKARDEFMSIAAHELRTPLTPLVLHLAALQRALRHAPCDDEDGRLGKKVEQGIRAANRLTKLIEGLLDVSGITSGKLRLDREQVELGALVREVAQRFFYEASAMGSKLVVRVDDQIEGTWDRMRVEQVITNLLSNAIKYGAGQPIEISAVANAINVTITVRDQGIGIPPEDQAHIFDRFERAVSSRQYGGLGLGLYITREIVEAHGGSVAVESRPGAGSVFTVTLPRRPVTRPQADAAAPLS